MLSFSLLTILASEIKMIGSFSRRRCKGTPQQSTLPPPSPAAVKAPFPNDPSFMSFSPSFEAVTTLLNAFARLLLILPSLLLLLLVLLELLLELLLIEDGG